MNSQVQFRCFTLGDFLTDCYLVSWDRSALLIDPAVSAPEIDDWIQQNGLTLEYILNTHGHIDHIGGNRYYKERYPGAKLIVHEQEIRFLNDPALNLSSEINRSYRSPDPDDVLRGSEGSYSFGALTIEYLLTPGHTPGSVCLFFPETQWLFSGDTLFAGSIGRTDLPGGSYREIAASLIKLCNRFDPASDILPGHGPQSTLRVETDSNPFVLEFLENADQRSDRDS